MAISKNINDQPLTPALEVALLKMQSLHRNCMTPAGRRMTDGDWANLARKPQNLVTNAFISAPVEHICPSVRDWLLPEAHARRRTLSKLLFA
jgi:hypothetical protein